MKYCLLIIFLGLILSSCASSGYHQVADTKIISPVPPVSSQEDAAMVIIKRNKGIGGSALHGRFFYDGQHIVTLSRGETFTFYADPGQHILGVKSYQPIMLVPTPFHRKIEVMFEAGKTYEYIIKNIFSAGLKISEVKENITQ